MTALPTIHFNGSGIDNLSEEYTAALNALHYAREALVHSTLHMRDFYPQGDEAYIQAREERTEVFRKYQEIEQYLTDWVHHLYQQRQLRIVA